MSARVCCLLLRLLCVRPPQGFSGFSRWCGRAHNILCLPGIALIWLLVALGPGCQPAGTQLAADGALATGSEGTVAQHRAADGASTTAVLPAPQAPAAGGSATAQSTLPGGGQTLQATVADPTPPPGGTARAETSASGERRVTITAAQPAARALTVLVFIGGAGFALGAFLVTPWGGANVRTGLLLIAASAGLIILTQVAPQLVVPAWLLPCALGLTAVWGITTYFLGRRHQAQDLSEL